MLISQISVPSCMTIEMNQLELLKESGSINNFEVSPDNTLITLYWTYLNKDETKTVSLSRVRQFAGHRCLSRASKAYLYYDDDKVLWVK